MNAEDDDAKVARENEKENHVMKKVIFILIAVLILIASAAFAEESSMTKEEAIELASQAICAELGNESVPLKDEKYFEIDCRHNPEMTRFYVSFLTKTLDFGTCKATVKAEDKSVRVTKAEKPEVDGDSLYDRYWDLYGSPMTWGQEIWVEFDQMLETMNPVSFDVLMLKKTVYPEASAVKLSKDEAAKLAAKDCGTKEEYAISYVLIDAKPNPVWKFRICSWEDNVDRLIEVDAVTGEILDREEYKADNYEFDNPIKMYTLHGDYAPAAIEHYGLAYMSAVEVSKRYGDMMLDDPMLPLLDEELYQVYAQEKTVTFKALTDENDTYRVNYDDGYMVKSIEVLK